jgi:hypothetical protein
VKRPATTKALLALLLATLSAAGVAADAPGRQACQADAHKHCAGERPGGGRVLGCLKQHESELSAACQAALPTLQRCAQEVKRDRKSTRLNSSHRLTSRMPSSA